MIKIVSIERPGDEDLMKAENEPEFGLHDSRKPDEHCPQALVPTIDIYSARVLFSLTQKMVEDAVDRRVSLLEKRIDERDREVMRAIRKIQTRFLLHQDPVKLPWWRKLFQRGSSM